MKVRLTPLRAIKLICLDCAGTSKLVRECDDEGCPAFGFRTGKHPARAGIGVGTRDKKGRFVRIITAPAATFGANTKSTSKTTSSVNLQPKSVDNAGIALSGKGHIKIKRTGKGMVIRLTHDG